MQRSVSIFAAFLAIVLLFSLIILPLQAQSDGANNGVFFLDHVIGFTSLPNGIEVRDGGALEQIVALRDDILRVRIARNDKLPEDASWAVLPEARHSSVSVVPEITADHVGFKTHSLRVEIARKTLALTIRDVDGNLLQQDALPARFEGNSFRIYKSKGADEHFFGLGDKTGPLDRANQAFTL